MQVLRLSVPSGVRDPKDLGLSRLLHRPEAKGWVKSGVAGARPLPIPDASG